MKTARLQSRGVICAALSALCAIHGANAQTASDTLGCIRPTPVHVVECFDGWHGSPRICLEMIDAGLADIATWERCISDRMSERHAKDRQGLAQLVQERRASLIRNIVLFSK